MHKVLAAIILLCSMPLFAAEVRILSLCAAANDILIRTGQKDKLAAIDHFGRIVPGTGEIPVIARGTAISAEKAVELGITHIIAWEYQGEVEKILPRCKVLKLPVIRAANYEEAVLAVCGITGAEKAGRELAAEFKKYMAPDENPAAGRPKIYLELYSPFKTAGEESYANDLIKLAGGTNIGASLPRSGTIGAEKIVLEKPDIILYIDGFGSVEEISRRPGFRNLPAVAGKRIYGVDRKLFVAGLDPAGAVRTLRKYIHNQGVD